MSSLLAGLAGCPNGESSSPPLYGASDNTVVVTLTGVGQGRLPDPTFEQNGDCFLGDACKIGSRKTERSAGTIKKR